MELARHAWRKSLLVYKGSLKNALRNSGGRAAFAGAAQRSEDSFGGGTLDRTERFGDAKHEERVSDALGATDELSSYIGLAREFACDSKVEHPYVDKLKRVQMILFDLNDTISRSSAVAKAESGFENKHTKDLEEWTMEYANQLPPPEDYIIPGGGKACASLHVARTICKRAERSVTPLVREGALDQEAQIYLNRLCEFLLTVSRMAAKCDQRSENIYIPRSQLNKEAK